MENYTMEKYKKNDSYKKSFVRKIIRTKNDSYKMYSFKNTFCTRRIQAGEVRGLSNPKLVAEAHEQTQQALHDYCVNNYPQIPVRFS